jgi:ribulose-bisphosphate carboxylase large chain
MEQNQKLALSGLRFSVIYRLMGDEKEAYARARDICIEQTVEFPEELIPEGDIRDHLLGRIEQFEPAKGGIYTARISYPVELTAFNLLQFLNVVFGNISIKPGIRVERLELPEPFLQSFRGPRFGKAGLRALLGVPSRPLLCTAIKPMGLSVKALAQMAYEFALGGIDLIKDDHGINDQPFSPFADRVQAVVESVGRANQETGERCLYLPTILGPMERVHTLARQAKQFGAGGLLILPGLLGLDTMRMLADDDDLSLPIMSHPTFYGTYAVGETIGFSHFVLYGQLMRLAGGDCSIYTSFGGRFSFTREECDQIVAGCNVEMGAIRPIFPTPGGGMTLERIPELLELYGQDVVFLIGGGLHRGADLVETCRGFRRLVER